ncbi:MAG: InlB B-repeat-containing protein [Desulfobacteraceae bacterium]|jgi:hypothetical protein|nr:InlB B-repeat-containing protein [Desulfobacteraceae bacterium]
MFTYIYLPKFKRISLLRECKLVGSLCIAIIALTALVAYGDSGYSSSYRIGDASYRSLNNDLGLYYLFPGFNHTGVVGYVGSSDQYSGIYEMAPGGCNYNTMAVHKAAGYAQLWYGVYTVEGDLTSNERTAIRNVASDIFDDPDITYTWDDVLKHESGIGSTVERYEITDLRCDGLVEFAYESLDHQVWGPTENGSVVNWDISITDNVDDHADFGKDDPWRELCPYIQRGGDYLDSPYTNFGPSFPPPTFVFASDGSFTDRVTISWNYIPDISYYRVYRATSSNGIKTAIGNWQTSSVYNDTSATPGTTYYYFVKGAEDNSGRNAGGYSGYNTGWRNATYTISYSANGATSGSAPPLQTKTHDVSLTLRTNTGNLDRTGYTFTGWNTSPSGTGTHYPAGGIYTANASDVLYAEWTALPTYTVSYNANGATSGSVPAPQTKTHDVSLTLRTNTGNLARAGCIFAGWNTSSSGTGTHYSAGGIYTANASDVLYAEWTALPIINPIGNDSVNEGTAYTGPTPTLSQGTPPVTWTLTDGPSGMTINNTTGVVSWPNPTTVGSPHFITIRANNSAGYDDETWTLEVNPVSIQPIINPISNESINEGIAYTGPTPSLSHGTLPVTWALITGPSGMTINSNTGIVSWSNPTVSGSPHTITIRASNSAGYDDESWALTINDIVQIVFVNADALGANNGSSWADAFVDLNNALAIAQTGDEIWVAEGVYLPGTERLSSFQLKQNVSLFGGFKGHETSINERNWKENETILSGDINGDDVGIENNTENVFHVLIGANDAVLDGFIVTGGHANGSYPHFYGAGVYNWPASPIISNCKFINNRAEAGGGALFFVNSNPIIDKCLFIDNYGQMGGAIDNEASDTTISNCIFNGNVADNGGTTVGYGGAIFIDEGSNVQIANCTFAGNRTNTYGGAVCNKYLSNTLIKNSILWGNAAPNGSELHNNNAELTVEYCNIDQDGYEDIAGNFRLDPLFGSDFHIQANSPCINTGDPTSATPQFPSTDIDGDIRPQSLIYDVGADEFYDSDFDTIPDYWEYKWFGNLNQDSTTDWDNDGRTDLSEFINASNPRDTGPNISVNLDSFDYGSLAYGGYIDKKFIVTNEGTGILHINGAYIEGTYPDQFAIIHGYLPSDIYPQSNHEITVRFEPTQTGSYDAAIRISSNDPDEQNLYVTLIGRAVQPGSFLNDALQNVPGATAGVSWGDIDNDEDLDFAIIGMRDDRVTELYVNEEMVLNFDPSQNFIPVVGNENEGSITWIDYDNDGDLDLSYCGYDGGSYVTKIYENEGGSFIDSLQNVLGLTGNLFWADYDNDGDVDLFATGYRNGPFSRLYRNENGILVWDSSQNLDNLAYSSASWGDFDNDGDFDLAHFGYNGSENVGNIYKNNNGILLKDEAHAVIGLDESTVSWVDYDNDGDLDLAVTGCFDSRFHSAFYIFKNINGTLSEDLSNRIEGFGESTTFSYGDYDNDGDYDFLIRGIFYLNQNGNIIIDTNKENLDFEFGPWSIDSGDYDNDGDLDIIGSGYREIKIFKNTISEFSPNELPVPPNADSFVSVISEIDQLVMLFWGNGSDLESNINTLNYNIRIGTASGSHDVVSGIIQPGPGNVGISNSYKLYGLDPGTYYWSVQTIDTGFSKSEWSNEKIFVVPILEDSDGDGILDYLEALLGTNPNDADSDDDGLLDGAEDENHNGIFDENETNPIDADTDDDGIQDGTELGYQLDDIGTDTDIDVFQPDPTPSTTTDPLDFDTDNDGIQDGTESGVTQDNIGPDTDLNTFQPDLNSSETTDPNNRDSDGDGVIDGDEDSNQNGRVDSGETNPNQVEYNHAILFVDDDEGDGLETFFIDALDGSFFEYQNWDVNFVGNSPSSQFMSNFKVIIWNTGFEYSASTSGLTDNEQQQISEYLDQGGSIFISGQDILYNGVSSDFLNNYLHVSSYQSDTSSNSVVGLSSDPISDGLNLTLDFPFTDFSDSISPYPDAIGIFHRNGISENYNALRYPASDPSPFKLVFFAFPFEAVSYTDIYPNNSVVLMERIVEWLSGILIGDVDNDGDCDGLDISNFINAYANLNSDADLNEDGAVNELDIEIIAESFGKIE